MLINPTSAFASPHEAFFAANIFVGLDTQETKEFDGGSFNEWGEWEENEDPGGLTGMDCYSAPLPKPPRGTRIKGVWPPGGDVRGTWQGVRAAVSQMQKIGKVDLGDDIGLEFMHDRHDSKPGELWWQKEVAKTQAGYLRRTVDGD